jgi:catechol 2,3-dioxygenase-like lactoylglutathione lyase family enzyme
MLGRLDHVGYLAADLEAAVSEFARTLGVAVGRRFERPQFALRGVYLGSGEGELELFTFTEPDLLAARLGSASVRLDHIAYEVTDIERTARALREAGVSFCGPDLRAELSEPVALGGVLHLWTVPASSCGQSIQLLQR